MRIQHKKSPVQFTPGSCNFRAGGASGPCGGPMPTLSHYDAIVALSIDKDLTVVVWSVPFHVGKTVNSNKR